MNVKIVATKSCRHSLNVQHELRDMDIPFEVLFVEDHPDVVMAHDIRTWSWPTTFDILRTSS
jgi:hypothetical protein